MRKNLLYKIAIAGTSLSLLAALTLPSMPLIAQAQSTLTVPTQIDSQSTVNNVSQATSPAPATSAPAPAPAVATTPTTNSPSSSYTLLEALPCIPGNGITCPSGGSGSNVTYVTSVNFQQYVQYFINLLIALAAAAAVFMITLGGFEYMTTDSVTGKSAGLDKVKNAIYGLLLVLCSYLIVRTIDPRLVAIPSSLVTPIQIQQTDYLSQLLGQTGQAAQDVITQQADALRNQNMTLVNQLSQQQQQVTSLQSQQTNATLQLATDANYSGTLGQNDINSICAAAATSAITEDCLEINEASQQLSSTQVSMTQETAQGEMNALIQECLASGTSGSSGLLGGQVDGQNNTTLATCQSDIQAKETQYAAQLTAQGRPDLAQTVQQQALFAQSMAAMNDLVRQNMTLNPNSVAILNSAETAITTGTTAAGGATGGLFGATIGLTAGSLINGTLSENSLAEEKEEAQSTANQINVLMANTQVTDPVIKAQLQAQATALVTALGGTNQVPVVPVVPPGQISFPPSYPH